MPNPHSGPLPREEDVRTIERDELARKLASDEQLKLVMALNAWAYQAKRIPKSVYFDTPDDMLRALKKDDEIVVYCSNPQCLASLAMYRRLIDHGYVNVRRYAGGLNDWEDAGLPLEGDWVTKSL